jgi:hypothetical protein
MWNFTAGPVLRCPRRLVALQQVLSEIASPNAAQKGLFLLRLSQPDRAASPECDSSDPHWLMEDIDTTGTSKSLYWSSVSGACIISTGSSSCRRLGHDGDALGCPRRRGAPPRDTAGCLCAGMTAPRPSSSRMRAHRSCRNSIYAGPLELEAGNHGRWSSLWSNLRTSLRS